MFLNNKSKEDGNIRKIIKILIMLFVSVVLISLLAIQVNNLFNFLKYINNDRDLLNFKYFKSSKNEIEKVDKYILEKEKEGYKVYILDFTAALYMIPLNKYNKDFDMFMKGNFGVKGEKGLILQLENNKENTIVLVLQSKYSMNWQTPLSVVRYIRNEWELTDKVSKFDVYVYNN